jgi:glycosyltransferase involved in cell wall biosynthesis
MSDAGPTKQRFAVVSHACVYNASKGNSQYLDQVVRALVGEGFDGHYVATLQGGAAPPVGLKRYLEPYTTVAYSRRLIIGRHAYALHPRPWLGYLLRRPFRALRSRLSPKQCLRKEGPRLLWNKPDLGGADLTWIEQHLRRLSPKVVIGNYFNVSTVFPRLPQDTLRVLLVHDVMALRAESMRAAKVPFDFDLSMAERETNAFSEADLCVAIKPEEADYIRSVAAGTRVVVAPHPVTVRRRPAAPTVEPRAVFVGSNNFPNRDALAWLLAEVWPIVVHRLPKASLQVVGAVGSTYDGPWPKGASPVGVVQDLDATYDQAALALVPLRTGSGLKVKLAEALAAGLRVVATPVGAEGVRGAPSDILTIANTAQAFADAVCAALSKPQPAKSRERGFQFAEDQFSPTAIAQALAAEFSVGRGG